MANTLADTIIRIRSSYDASGTDRAKREVKSLENGIARAGQAASLLAARSRDAFLITSLVGGAAAKVFADVEKAEVDLVRVTNLNGAAFARLRTEVTLAGRGLGLTEQQSLSLATQAARLGIAGGDIVSFVRTTQQAAVALNQDVTQVSTTLAKLRANLQLSVGELDRLTGAIIALDNVSAAAFPDILAAMVRVGPVASLLGISGQQLAAISAALIETGISAEVAGTALSQILQSLLRRSEKLGPILGVTGQQLRNMVRNNPVAVLRLVAETFSRLNATGQDTSEFLSALALDGRRATAVMAILGDRTGRLDELLRGANAEMQKGTLLAKLFGAQANTLAFRFQQFKASIFAAASEIGRRLAPVIIVIFEVLGKIADAISRTPLLQYAIAFGLVATAVAAAASFLVFFAASQVIAFRVARQALPFLTAQYRSLAGAISGAAAAQTAFDLSGLVGVKLGRSAGAAAGATAARAPFNLSGIVGRVGPTGGILGALNAGAAGSAIRGIANALRLVGGIASRVFFPVLIAVSAFEAIRGNLLGSRDAIVDLVKPFGKIFGGEGKQSLRVFFDLLRAITQITATLAAVLIRVVTTVLKPFVIVIATLADLVLKIINFIGRLFGLGKGGSAAGTTTGTLPTRSDGGDGPRPPQGPTPPSTPLSLPLISQPQVASALSTSNVTRVPASTLRSVDPRTVQSSGVVPVRDVNVNLKFDGRTTRDDANFIAKEVRRVVRDALTSTASKAGAV